MKSKPETPFTVHPGATTKVSDSMSFVFELAFEETNVSDVIEVVWETVPDRTSDKTEAGIS